MGLKMNERSNEQQQQINVQYYLNCCTVGKHMTVSTNTMSHSCLMQLHVHVPGY